MKQQIQDMLRFHLILIIFKVFIMKQQIQGMLRFHRR